MFLRFKKREPDKTAVKLFERSLTRY